MTAINPIAAALWSFLLGSAGIALVAVIRSRRRTRAWPRVTARLVQPQGHVRIKGRSMSVTFDTPAGPVTTRLAGNVRVTEDDAASRNDTLLVVYDPANPSHATVAPESPLGRGALVFWSIAFGLLLMVFSYTQLLR